MKFGKLVMKFFYTYILQSLKDQKLYTGSTKNLPKRFEQHQSGQVFSTAHRRPFKLIYYEACIEEDDARRREKSLKSYRGKMFIKRRLKSYFTGFTLVETLLAVAIFSLIIGVLITFERDMFHQNSFYQNTLLADQDARRSLRQMVAELRAAVSSATGAYPIAEATTNSLIFFSDVDKNGSHDRVRYFLDGSTLKRGVIEPTESPVGYDPATETLETLSDGLIHPNQIIFNYFDRNYAGTSTPMAFPVDISAIRLIKITLKIKESVYSTQVVIRSLKDNL